jgi:amino acid transporter
LSVRQAAFIGVGAMVGAGIFALLGAAGEVAGAAVWLSFLIAGVIAGLQGYSLARFGARYPSGGTALAVAAEPTLGRAGYWMMSVTALFATAGATNSGLYPATGLCGEMTSIGQFPPLLGRRFGGRASAGLLVTAPLLAPGGQAHPA